VAAYAALGEGAKICLSGQIMLRTLWSNPSAALSRAAMAGSPQRHGGAGGGANAPATLAWPVQGKACACVASPGAWRCQREDTSAVLRSPPIRLTVWPWAASKRASGATAGLASRPRGQSSAHAAGPVPPGAFNGCRQCRASTPGAAPTAGGSQRRAGAACPTRPQGAGPLGEEPHRRQPAA
jgi:hypothetical protein